MVRQLRRIADALERRDGTGAETGADAKVQADLRDGGVYVWDAARGGLKAVDSFGPLPLKQLVGIDDQRRRLWENTVRFASGKAANSVLLWGARGSGKSALVKAVFAAAAKEYKALRLVEIARDDLDTLPELVAVLRAAKGRFIVFCDDLSFGAQEGLGKALKSILDGGVDAAPDHVVFYATSNRRHLVPRDMVENEARAAIHSREAQDEHIALSDRFGLWIGFHPVTQDDYLAMVRGYADYFGVDKGAELERAALEWAAARGGISGRVAWQFMQSVR